MTTTVLVLIGLLALWALWFAARLLFGGMVETWRPAELRGARLVMVERDLFAGSGELALAGRPDRVYRTRANLHVPVEYKTRYGFRLYETDCAQLSLQAWQLRRTGRATGPTGYVVVSEQGSRKRRALAVQLGDDAYCEALMRRYHALRRNGNDAQRNTGPKCKTCGHRAHC